MNLERLRALHAVSVYGSVMAAAEMLHITPSAASQQLAKLEREVDTPLLERHGRGIRLTESARLLALHAEQILAAVEHARADLEEHRGTVHGSLSIAAFATASRGLLPQVAATLHNAHPELDVRILEHDPDVALPEVLRGTIDVAVTQSWPSNPFVLPAGLTGVTLFDDVVDLAVPARHPLADSIAVSVSELTDQPWISWPAGSSCRQWLIATLRANGVEPRIVHEAAEHPTQLALVGAGLGVAIVPRLGRGSTTPGVHFLSLEPVAMRHVQAVWRDGARRRPAVAAALSALSSVHAALPGADVRPP